MKTTLIRSIHHLHPSRKGCVVTIGNFDGVHLGHQRLIKLVRDKAKELNTQSLIITFEPHPFEFFARDKLQIPRLTRFREKFSALARAKVDNVLLLPFNQSVANISASDFVTEILFYGLGIKHIIVGDDFQFGRERKGNTELLIKMGHELGFGVESLSTVTANGARISSTRVRNALAHGDLNEAAQLLGRPYTMQGRVRHGDKLGRQWGFPTANIYLHRKLTPVKGVFTVLVHGLSQSAMQGVANVGVRPTVNGTRTLLEVHLLDFDQMIYGKYVEVEFCHKLREEIRYPNVELLKQQIGRDVIAARNYFEECKMLRGVR